MTNHEITERFIDFYADYYRQEIGELANGYPKDGKTLHIEHADLWQFDMNLADDWLTQPETMQEYAEEALRNYDLPVDVSLNQARVRLTDTEQSITRIGVGDIASHHIGEYQAITGQIGQVTGRMSRIEVAAFECQRCGTLTKIPQSFFTFQEPHECQGCERSGPFQLNHAQSEFVDQRKLQLEQPPEEQTNGGSETITAFCIGEMAEVGGENGLQDRAGSRVTIMSAVHMDDSDLYGRGQKEPVVEHYLKPQAFIFDEDDDDEIDL